MDVLITYILCWRSRHKVYMGCQYRRKYWAHCLDRLERPTDNRKVMSSNLIGPTHLFFALTLDEISFSTGFHLLCLYANVRLFIPSFRERVAGQPPYQDVYRTVEVAVYNKAAFGTHVCPYLQAFPHACSASAAYLGRPPGIDEDYLTASFYRFVDEPPPQHPQGCVVVCVRHAFSSGFAS